MLRRRTAEEDDRYHAQRTAMICEYYGTRRVLRFLWVNNRTSAWWEMVVPTYTNVQWIKDFRMSKCSFQLLCMRLEATLGRRNTNYRECVPVPKKIAIALWKLATNSEYRTISHLFGVGRSTVCCCVQEFCSAVVTLLLPEFMPWPNSEKLEEMALYFEGRWGVLQCVGAVDGSHIPILRPEEYHNEYFNRKGWHSVILQGVVDGKGLFWSVFVGLPGSMHDSRVFSLSSLVSCVDRGGLLPHVTKNIGGHDVGYYILGDSAYPLQRWLMKPFQGRLTPQQHVYNRKTSRARVVVENAFGRLKGRWRCLMKRNDCNMDNIKIQVAACCVLHNLCERRGDEYREEWTALPATQLDGPAPDIVEDRTIQVKY
ncbi:protein ANTAGONIST OF LIKE HETEROCHROMATIN PROTEIN 1-like [Trematomus bernacchii]|uniref:protein ANTAGONIST OF LIKE HETEROCHROMATIN PROTEIN 1-like n=1 Tax=Trematomus bernacchii TaxID=40690 RepID=UPI00146C7121|nr:protein ANTAGONIST OF LIKE HETEROCHROMATIN PROTEIN 1-like [Trematomus bernacchii]